MGACIRLLCALQVKTAKASTALGAADARGALIREAALGVLLDHRNVIATLGIVTVPRDVPALLILSFCAEGSLEELAADATPDSLTVSARLTYCAQVLQGLQYIAAIRIVHRDVATRNVLLDATMTAKVSDFGMATALQEDGKGYIRADELLALRWCAVEVIKEGKYSVQSDVWAFGVLAYEVFASGTLPYADQFDNLTEVSSAIKEGTKLTRPNPAACPAAVYEQLMLPCFAADPADRPSFGQLYTVAVEHGAEEDNEARAERMLKQQQRSAAADARANPNDRALLGPSVYHLEATLIPAVQQAIETIKRDRGHPDQAVYAGLDTADASIWHTVHAFAKTHSEHWVCPRDGGVGCAYVDTLSGVDDVGPATALLSYSWGYRVAEVSAALSAWTERTGRDPKRTRIWLCSLCLNQHSFEGRVAVIGEPDADRSEALLKIFGDRVLAIGRILPMLEPWDDPGYVKRAWCLFELHTAITRDVEIDIILSPKQAQAFRDRINRDGSDARAIDEALGGIKSEEATASVHGDLTAIRALIQQYSGGFGTLNDTVRLFLRQWFVSQGGINVVARAGNAKGRRSVALAAPPRPVVERVRIPRIAAANLGAWTSTHFVGKVRLPGIIAASTVGDQSQSRVVMNPVWGLTQSAPQQGAPGRTSEPTVTLPQPGTRSLALSPPATNPAWGLTAPQQRAPGRTSEPTVTLPQPGTRSLALNLPATTHSRPVAYVTHAV